MNKSKTIILTIIAVVTLLGVVAGATFAYFTFTSTISSDTNTITGTTGSVGSITLTSSTTALHITTVAEDFSETNKGDVYWSTNSTTDNYRTSSSSYKMHDLKVTGGADNTIYKCTYTLTLTTTGLPESGVKAGDYVVYFKDSADNNFTKSLDMATVANRTASYTITRYLTGPSTKSINGYSKLTNRDADQNYLQGLTIVTSYTASNLSCEIVSSVGTDSFVEQ